MKLFIVIFTLMGVYGLLSGFYGAGLMSFAMLGLMLWARKELGKREVEYLADPANAKPPREATQLLVDKSSEGGRSTF